MSDVIGNQRHQHILPSSANLEPDTTAIHWSPDGRPGHQRLLMHGQGRELWALIQPGADASDEVEQGVRRGPSLSIGSPLAS